MNNNSKYVCTSKDGTAYKPTLRNTPISNIYNILYLD